MFCICTLHVAQYFKDENLFPMHVLIAHMPCYLIRESIVHQFFLSAVLLLWHCLIAWYVCLHTFVTSAPIKKFLWIACYDWRFPSSFHDSNNKVHHCLRLINEQNLKESYRLTSLLALSSRLSLFCCISSISSKSLLTPFPLFPLFLNKRRSLQL